VSRPAIFVVKATITPEREAAFNEWYNTQRASEASRVPGCLAMRRYEAIPLDTDHVGAEPWQYMVIYEFESEAALHDFVHSDTLKAMTRDYNTRFAGAGERARFTYRQIFP
jgi:heme-degrading monooxygenase HmoA